MIGLSTIGSISLGIAFVAGRKRVPSPAAGKTALRTLAGIVSSVIGKAVKCRVRGSYFMHCNLKAMIAPAVLLFCFPLHAQVTVIRNARVVDGTGSPARLASVVIRDSRITAVVENELLDIAGDAAPRVIDAGGKTLLPGLFDLHTHLSASPATGLSADWGKDLKAYLASGVTTVNDFSAYGEMFEPMRRLMASGAMPGPRVQLAFRMSTPGGHGTEGGWGDFFTLTASTAEEAHAQMKRILP